MSRDYGTQTGRNEAKTNERSKALTQTKPLNHRFKSASEPLVEVKFQNKNPQLPLETDWMACALGKGWGALANHEPHAQTKGPSVEFCLHFLTIPNSKHSSAARISTN